MQHAHRGANGTTRRIDHLAPFGQNVRMETTLSGGTPPATDPVAGPEAKRLRLLDAGAEQFAALGYAKTTVGEIARAAGVSKGLLYVHFGSKEELFLAVLERTLEQWGEVARQGVEDQDSVRGALETMHESSLEYASANPLLRRIFAHDAALVRSLVEERSERADTEWILELRELFERGRDNGELRSDLDVEHAVHAYRLLHLSFLDRLMEQPASPPLSPDLIRGAMGLLLDGMCAANRSVAQGAER